MPIIEDAQVRVEKKIVRIEIDVEARQVLYRVRLRTVGSSGQVLGESFKDVLVSGKKFQELGQLKPVDMNGQPIEAAMPYYDNLGYVSYQFLKEMGEV